MDGGNAVGVKTIIVNPYNFECVWIRLQPLDEFAAKVVDSNDGDAAAKVASLRQPQDERTKTKAATSQQQKGARHEGEGKGAQWRRLSIDEE